VETWDAIRARRNVRGFADRPIEAGDLDRILEAGRRAPSSMNQQAWDFVAVRDRDRLKRLADVWRYAAHVANAEVLELPADRECMWLIALGEPSGPPLRPIDRPGRRAFDDVVHRERW
jgi:nitroreductase